VTNTVAVVPGFIGGSVAYREELSRQRENIIAVVPPALFGAVAGAFILLNTPESAFKVIVPFLIFGACMLLAYQDRVSAYFRRDVAMADVHPHWWAVRIGIFLIAIYGAYFGAGFGIIILAVFGVFLPDDIQRSNALKGIVSFCVNAVAAVYFAIFGHVAWEAAAVMAVATLIGGFFGVRLARKLSRQTLRRGVITYGLFAAAILFGRLFV
jgi:uncharacterized protein